jgi:hypothetical protein
LGLFTYYKSGQLFRTSGGGGSDPESNQKDHAQVRKEREEARRKELIEEAKMIVIEITEK